MRSITISPGCTISSCATPRASRMSLAPTHWGQRNRRVYGEAQAALIGWGAFFRKEWLSVLDELPPAHAPGSAFPARSRRVFQPAAASGSTTPCPARLRTWTGTPRRASLCGATRATRRLTSLAIRQALRLAAPQEKPRAPGALERGHSLSQLRALSARDRGVRARQRCRLRDPHRGRRVERRNARAWPPISPGNIRTSITCATRKSAARVIREIAGIAALESEFVVLLDADDRIGPDYLFRAGQRLAGGADVVNPDAVLFGATQDRWVVPEVTTLKMLLQRNSVHCCSAFRRELWSRVGGIDEQMPCWMDYEFWIRLAAAGARIQRTPRRPLLPPPAWGLSLELRRDHSARTPPVSASKAHPLI